ncbi:MAG: hypothetical protein ACKOX6_04715 [Bdellovibrio sp.]
MNWLILFFCLILTSCLEGGSDISIGTASPGSPAAPSMAVEKILGKSKNEWTVDSLGKIYLNSATVTIEGRCSRGVGRISVIINGTIDSVEASCGAGGTFSWSKFFPSSTPHLGNEYAIELQGLRADGAALAGLTTSKVIIIDTHAPSAPYLNAVSGCRLSTGIWTCSDSHVRVSGGWTGGEGVVSLQYPSGGVISYPSANGFSFEMDLTEGQTRSLAFTVKDLVGNVSGAGVMSVSYFSLTTILAASVSSGGASGFSGGPVNSSPSLIGNLDSLSGKAVDLNSSGADNQKVQMLIGPMAVGAQWLNP